MEIKRCWNFIFWGWRFDKSEKGWQEHRFYTLQRDWKWENWSSMVTLSCSLCSAGNFALKDASRVLRRRQITGIRSGYLAKILSIEMHWACQCGSCARRVRILKHIQYGDMMYTFLLINLKFWIKRFASSASLNLWTNMNQHAIW